MPNETVSVIANPVDGAGSAIERLLMRDIAGMPAAFVACALAAVAFGGLIAMTAGGH